MRPAFDGKHLLRTSDPTLSAEDIALGYKQLLEVERGWRTLKQVIDLRPVYHRKEDRIRALDIEAPKKILDLATTR